MFDDRLEGALGDPRALLRLAADNTAEERQASCRKLVIAAAWADCHGAPAGLELVDGEPRHQSVVVDRFVRMGGQGTPLVAESCPAELGNPHQCGPVASRNLIGDALSIRHRLPALWQRVLAGQVWGWKAREIAKRCSHLGQLSAWVVDRLVTPHVELMAWARFEKVLDATLLYADEATYQQRADQTAARRDARIVGSEQGLRTLVARLEAGDASAFMALVERVAQCLADDGDEDPVGMRRSKAFDIIAHQAMLRDLLARHGDQPDDPRHPEQRVAAHQADPTDPWAADDLPLAGWQTAAHGNYHQPRLDDLDDIDEDYLTSQTTPPEPEFNWGEETPVDHADQAWYHQHRDTAAAGSADHAEGGGNTAGTADRGANETAANPDQSKQPDTASGPSAAAADSATPAGPTVPADPTVPAAFNRHAGGARCQCGSTFDLRPYTKAELNACRTRTVVHVHVTDQTLIDQHGVLRTDAGPITLNQFRRWLTDAEANLTIKPVLDAAAVAAVDAYEIPLAVREAVHARHPGSVWPFSSVTEITTGGRLDLDHTIPYHPNGPPGQTGTSTLGPLARSEHRPKTIADWHARQPNPGTYLWRSPHGWISIVTNQGSLMLGDTPWTRSIWRAASDDAA